jgi:hypothetical protein
MWIVGSNNLLNTHRLDSNTKYSMKQYVRVLCDVDCVWQQPCPRYRVFVNNELFAERGWSWTDSTLEEVIQIEAQPGEYVISYQLLPHESAELITGNLRVDHGSADVDGWTVTIHPCDSEN